GIEGKVVSAISQPDMYHSYRDIGFGYNSSDDVLYIRLPSGRDLCYHQPRLTRIEDRRRLPVYQISYMGVNNDPGKPKIWMRIVTWGSRIFENIVQAVCRDIEAAAMLKLEAAGYPVVLHTHDEPCSEVPHGFGSIEEYERIMMTPESWYADWPVRASGGWRGLRFRK
ncbi:MAG: hypothetical protein GWN00_32790, partial [Aliifodinibius sp.]|nr:hypothetical protein [Phycisphaerae bacterium]NIR66914.1 hypothetical protein [candidate division Zixibacteria bacterium]NIT60814.1 hypothetical protein [Fodinibius sp.]NIW48405.1 hypothetical protein [Gammaproteobacteria bacterium]NIS52132.1 hypothetical protein [Phycisphaerae bacterium]